MPLRVIGLHPGHGSHSMFLGDLLTPEAERDSQQATSMLEAFRDSRRLFPILTANLNEFLRAEQTLNGVLAQKGYDPELAGALQTDVNRTFANLLTSIRLYRDHTLTRLSRSYGRRSSEREHFGNAWQAAIDAYFPFGFTWELRNYVQHCGLPFDVASVYAKDPATAEGRLVDVGLRRDTLLKQHDWGPLSSQVRALPETIKIEHFLQPAIERLLELDRSLVGYERPALLSAARALIQILRTGFTNGAWAGTAEVKDSTPPTGMLRCHLAPAEVLVQLGLASISQTDAGPKLTIGDAA